jgi:hypothetical protein
MEYININPNYDFSGEFRHIYGRFKTAESAFQASKFKYDVDNFREADGNFAFDLKKS